MGLYYPDRDCVANDSKQGAERSVLESIDPGTGLTVEELIRACMRKRNADELIRHLKERERQKSKNVPVS